MKHQRVRHGLGVGIVLLMSGCRQPAPETLTFRVAPDAKISIHISGSGEYTQSASRIGDAIQMTYRKSTPEGAVLVQASAQVALLEKNQQDLTILTRLKVGQPLRVKVEGLEQVRLNGNPMTERVPLSSGHYEVRITGRLPNP